MTGASTSRTGRVSRSAAERRGIGAPNSALEQNMAYAFATLHPNPRIGEFLSRKLGPASTTHCFNANVRYATRCSRPHVKTRSIARPNVGYEHFVMKEEEHHEERSGSDRRDKDSRKARHN